MGFTIDGSFHAFCVWALLCVHVRTNGQGRHFLLSTKLLARRRLMARVRVCLRQLTLQTAQTHAAPATQRSGFSHLFHALTHSRQLNTKCAARLIPWTFLRLLSAICEL